MRRIAVIFALLIFGSSARADVANVDFLGFSDDGSIFAFKQSGTLDGAGYSYAEWHLVSASDGMSLVGSPYRIEDTSGTKLPNQLRILNAPELEGKLSNISKDNTIALVARLITDVSLNPHEVAFYLSEEEIGRGGAPASLLLKKKPLEDDKECSAGLERNTSFTLHLSLNEIDKAPTSSVVYNQKSEWGCVIDYRISSIYIFKKDLLPSSLAVIILVETYGNSGPNIRWTGAALSLDDG